MQAKTPLGDAEGVYLLDPATGIPYIAGQSGGSGSRLPVEPLGQPGVSRKVTATVTSANTVLTSTVVRISIKCRVASIRYAIGTTAQTALSTTSHFIDSGERLDLAVPLGCNIAVIRDSGATADGILEISELS